MSDEVERKRPSRWLRASLLCAAAPLFLAATASIVWWTTRTERAVWFGSLCFAIGVLLVCAGIFSLAVAHCQPERPTLRQTLLVILVLAINYPVAHLSVALPLLAKTTHLVVVTNETGAAIERVTFRSPGMLFSTGRLDPGQTETLAFRPAVEGALQFAVEPPGEALEGTVEAGILERDSRRILLRLLPGGKSAAEHSAVSWSFRETLALLGELGSSRGAAGRWTP